MEKKMASLRRPPEPTHLQQQPVHWPQRQFHCLHQPSLSDRNSGLIDNTSPIAPSPTPNPQTVAS
eukprot:m.142429 g.142429  ORF g.142429 m.142429 type:complete len:65 (-) comp17138_c0_seq2:73-267(-)